MDVYYLFVSLLCNTLNRNLASHCINAFVLLYYLFSLTVSMWFGLVLLFV